MEFEVTILGSSSATPAYNRHPTAQIVQVHERFFLVDCAEGTLLQFLRYQIRFHRIDHVFISHLHGDHYLGIMGVLSTLHLQGRTSPLHLYGPSALRSIIELQLNVSDTRLRYPLEFHSIDTTIQQVIYQDAAVRVTTLPMEHRIPCCGFLFEEQPRPRNLRKELLQGIGLENGHYEQLKSGLDVTLADGTILSSAAVSTAAPPPRRYAYCSDTLYMEGLSDRVRQVDLLYHEATFLHDMIDRARETYHSTALQAAQVARDAQVKGLLIGHFSARYKDLQPLLDEALSVFPDTRLAREGDRFSIPLADQPA